MIHTPISLQKHCVLSDRLATIRETITVRVLRHVEGKYQNLEADIRDEAIEGAVILSLILLLRGDKMSRESMQSFVASQVYNRPGFEGLVTMKSILDGVEETLLWAKSMAMISTSPVPDWKRFVDDVYLDMIPVCGV